MDDKKRTRGRGMNGVILAIPLTKMRKSCDACALAKRKCDGKTTCSLCSKRGSLCIYSERQKSGPKKAGSRADDTTASSPAKPTVLPPAKSRPAEGDAGGPGTTTASSNLPQEKRVAQGDSSSNWLSSAAIPCLEANAAPVNLPSRKAELTPAGARHIPKKAKKITEEREQAPLQKSWTQKDIAGAISMCCSAVSSSSIAANEIQVSRAMPVQMTYPTKPAVEHAVEALGIHTTCTAHPPTQADSEAEQLQVSALPILLNGENVPADANFQGASDVCRVPDMLTASAKHVVRLEWSTDGSSSGWEDLSDILLPTLEDEILWSCDEISDDDSVFGMGTGTTLGASEDNSFGVMSTSPAATNDIVSTAARGVLSAARLVDGRQQYHPHHHRYQHLELRQNKNSRLSQPPPSSASIVSLLEPISQDFKSLAIGGGGGRGSSLRFRPTCRARLRPGRPVGTAAHVAGTNTANCGESFGGGVSPISTWTQEAVEAGASTLLAVLADGDTGASLGGNEVGIGLGAAVTGAGSETRLDPRLARPKNFSGTGVPMRLPSLALQDPSSWQPPALQYSTASHVAQNMLEPLPYEGAPRNWTISKPNLASF